MASGWFSARQGRTQGDPAAAPRHKWLPRFGDRKQAVQPFTGAQETLDMRSRSRLGAGSIASLLVHDKQRFLQWLEGPVAGLQRVWRSLREDKLRRRAHPIEPSRKTQTQTQTQTQTPRPDQPVPVPPPRSPTLADGSVPHDALRPALVALIDAAVIPRLAAAHSSSRASAPATDPRVDDLAQLLLAKESAAAFALIDTMKADADSIASLCADLFEPAARSMGDLWRRDDCSEFDVTLGMGRLQMALHRCSAENAAPVPPGSAGRAVLLAPSPHESHLLGSVVALELFWRAGWDVSCDFPRNADDLNRLLHDRWFDVLELSLSSAFTREHRLEEMAATIRAARASSLNPALTVVVDGRVFHDHPQACIAVGADAGCACALDLLTIAARPSHSSLVH